VTFAVDVVFCVPTLEAGSTAGQVLRKPVAQWNCLQQAGSLILVLVANCQTERHSELPPSRFTLDF
jgi:hypothetical protein